MTTYEHMGAKFVLPPITMDIYVLWWKALKAHEGKLSQMALDFQGALAIIESGEFQDNEGKICDLKSKWGVAPPWVCRWVAETVNTAINLAITVPKAPSTP